MAHETLHGPPAATLARLLDDPDAFGFVRAARVVAGLSGEQAARVPPGAPHSVAALVAHLDADMAYNLALIGSAAPERVPHPPLWPAADAAGWPALAEAFLARLAALRRVAEAGEGLERVLFAANDAEPAWTVGYKLAQVAKHNAYHLGQAVLLRRLQGLWRNR